MAAPDSLIGDQHNAWLKWLVEKWWGDESPVCLLQGFPGVGKTRLADELEDQLKDRKTFRCHCPTFGVGVFDDLILTLASEFANKGDERLANSLNPKTLGDLLREPILIVIDEFQQSFSPEAPTPPKALANWIERMSGRRDLRGRVLFLSSRQVDDERWNERCEKVELQGLFPKDGAAFLAQRLEHEGLETECIPVERRKDVSKWLGGFPRALRLLVSLLRRESLDDLIGAAPEAWEARDQPVSRRLLRKIEKEMVIRARAGLPEEIDRFFERLAVFRVPVDRHAITSISQGLDKLDDWRDELLRRYLLDHRRGWYSMHPALREAVLLPLKDDDRQRAHAMAGRHFGRHFQAKRIVGSPAKLGSAFIEARYHFSQADDTDGLKGIAGRFEQHVRQSISWATPVPSTADELDERINLLSALLQGEGAKSLHFYLARLLERRNRPGDLDRALQHAKNGTGPRSPHDAWLLRLRIIAATESTEAALHDVRTYGLKELAPSKNLFSLYQSAAEIEARSGKPEDIQSALELLKEGIQRIEPQYNLTSLYQSAAEIQARSGQADEIQSAVELLKEGIQRIEPRFGVYSLYQSAAELYSRSGQAEDIKSAFDLLEEGIRRVGSHFGGPRLMEKAMLHCVAQSDRQLLKKIVDIAQSLGDFEPQLALARIHESAIKEDWEEAASNAPGLADDHPRLLTLAVHAAFSCLCAGRADEALNRLESFHELRHESEKTHTWLACLIQVELGNHSEANELLEIYLGRPLKGDEQANRDTLLEIWDRPSSADFYSRPPAYDFPILPPSLTGFSETVQRTTSSPPVLNSFRSAGKSAGTTEGVTQATPTEREPDRILRTMRPKGWSGLYICGCFDRRITVFTQQARALTLIRALFDAGDLEKGNKLGVIGGGFAGITAAVAAAHKGCEVTLFDANDAVLSLQSAARHRYLHPHIYDWPEPGSTNPVAGLPFLTWEAGYCDAIVRNLREEFEQHCAKFGEQLRHEKNATISHVRPHLAGDKRVQLIGNEAMIAERFHVVLVATGYGLEASTSYWTGDDLDGPFSSMQRILVSGSGDGGLVDVARAAMRSSDSDDFFRHDMAVNTLTENPTFRQVADKMLLVDKNARLAESLGREHDNLFQSYNQIEIGDDLLDQIRRLRRTKTEVTFNYRRESVFNLNSSLLNRLLVFLLMKSGVVKKKFGNLTGQNASPTAGLTRVEFDKTPDDTGNCDFHRIVLRFGPTQNTFASSFPNLEAACGELAGSVADLRLTQAISPETIEWFKHSTS